MWLASIQYKPTHCTVEGGKSGKQTNMRKLGEQKVNAMEDEAKNTRSEQTTTALHSTKYNIPVVLQS